MPLLDIRSKHGISVSTKHFGVMLGEHAEQTMRMVSQSFQKPPESPYILIFFSRKLVPTINLPSALNTRIIHDPDLSHYDIYRAVDVLLLPIGSELTVHHLEAILFNKDIVAYMNGIVSDYLPNECHLYRLVQGETQLFVVERTCSSLGLGEQCNTKSLRSMWQIPFGGLFNQAIRIASNSTASELPRNHSILQDYICQHYDWRQIAKVMLTELKLS